ncbi:hypothetical protein [Desulfococcus sp.]
MKLKIPLPEDIPESEKTRLVLTGVMKIHYGMAHNFHSGNIPRNSQFS